MYESDEEKCLGVFKDLYGHTLEIWSQPRGVVLRTFTSKSSYFSEFVIGEKNVKLLIDKLVIKEE